MTSCFELPLTVRFRDLDAMGHVNNAVMFTYFEEGRTQFFIRQTATDGPATFNFILAHVACDFRRPIKLEHRPLLRMWTGTVGAKSFEFFYQVVDATDPAVVFAEGRSVQVSFDYARNATVAVDQALRQRLDLYRRPAPEPAGAKA